MRKKPILANKFLIGAGRLFYGKKYFCKKVKLLPNGLNTIEPPYVVLANHCSFADVGGLIMSMYPKCANFVMSVTQIAKWPKLVWHMGVLPKKQFALDTSLIRDIKYVLQSKRPVAIFPEAKLSVVGTQNIIKPAVAKLVKMAKVPLVIVKFDGAYLHHPRWAKDSRKLPLASTVTVVDAKRVQSLTTEQLHQLIVDKLTFDDYEYQLTNKIEITSDTLVEGLEGILYKCPHCNAEYAMASKGDKLFCAKCASGVVMNKYGALEGGRFDSVTKWYNWQIDCVKQQLQEENYRYQQNFFAQVLQGKKYVDLGECLLVHDKNGLTATIDEKEYFFKTGVFYTLSFNNEYVYLPTEEGVLRLKRQKDMGCTTKLNIAIEQQTILHEQQKNAKEQAQVALSKE